jgi:hypothetical protein
MNRRTAARIHTLKSTSLADVLLGLSEIKIPRAVVMMERGMAHPDEFTRAVVMGEIIAEIDIRGHWWVKLEDMLSTGSTIESVVQAELAYVERNVANYGRRTAKAAAV